MSFHTLDLAVYAHSLLLSLYGSVTLPCYISYMNLASGGKTVTLYICKQSPTNS